MFVLLCMLLLGSSCSFQRVLVVGVQQQQRRLNASRRSRRSRRSCPNGTGAATSWLGGRRTSSNHQFPWTTRNSKPSVGLLFLPCVRLEEFEILDDCGIADSFEQTVLRPGQRAQARFEFLQGPQYVRSGMRVIIRDGHVRGVGIIAEVHTA